MSAERIGSQILLRFTAPTQTTDDEALVGDVRVDICRSVAGSTCTVVVSQKLQPGVNQIHDNLPDTLKAGSPMLMAYRTQLVNSSGRSAGWSESAYSVSGSAPDAIADPKATVRDDGALITWTPSTSVFDSVVLSRKENLPASAPGKKPPATVTLQIAAAKGDPGGAVDTAALVGHSYLYELRRIRKVELAARTVEVNSETVRLDTGTLQDVTAPAPPSGLEVAVSTDAIALSWQPNREADLAGYVIYRRDASGSNWKRLNEQPTLSPQYNDASVVKGNNYAYSITAVDRSSNESAKSEEITQEMR